MYTSTLSEYAREVKNNALWIAASHEHLIFTEITQIPDSYTDNGREFGPDHWG